MKNLIKPEERVFIMQKNVILSDQLVKELIILSKKIKKKKKIANYL